MINPHYTVHDDLHCDKTQKIVASVTSFIKIVNPIADLRMQHNAYYFNVLYACVARSAGWRKNLRNFLFKLRTPAIFSWGAIISDQDKIAGVPIKT